MQKIDKQEGREIDADLKQIMKISRVHPNDPNILIHKRRIQEYQDEIKDYENRLKYIDNITKETILDKEEIVSKLTTRCKKIYVDVINNMDMQTDATVGKSLKELKQMDHESGLYLDVLNDEHESIVESIKKVKEENVMMRVNLDRQRIQLNQMKRECEKNKGRKEDREIEVERLKKLLGRDDDEDDATEDDDVYDDPLVLARRREKKLKKHIQ